MTKASTRGNQKSCTHNLLWVKSYNKAMLKYSASTSELTYNKLPLF